MPASSSSMLTFSTEVSVNEIMHCIEKILKEKGITIFCRINHGKGAQDAGMTMQDEEVIIFGNPKTGTPLMIESPAVGIELPLKIVAWKDNKKTIVGIQNLDRLIEDYQLTKADEIIKHINLFFNRIG